MLVILFSTALFCGVVTMSVDRFLSIYFHLRYQGCCWSDLNRGSKYVFSLLALLVFPNIHSLFLFIGTAIGLLLTTLVYIKIYFTVRRYKNQIQVQQVHNAAPTGEIANFASLIKSACFVYISCF